MGIAALVMLGYVFWPSQPAAPSKADAQPFALKLDRELRLYPPGRN